MSTAFSVWMRAQGIFALCMLPTLVFAPMFFIAEFFAWVWGLPALFLFYFVLRALRKKQHYNIVLITIAGFVITLLCTIGAAWHFSEFKNPLDEFLNWMLFPSVGCVAALISMLSYRNTLKRYILGEEEIQLVDLETNVQKT